MTRARVGICAIRILERVDGRAVVDQHLPDLDRRWRSTAERLVEVVLRALPDAQQARKWGQLTFTRDRDWHHWICAIAPTTNAVKLVIHKGALLDDPQAAMEGNGRYQRAIRFEKPDQVDPDVVVPILREAAARQTDMLPSQQA